MTKKSVCIIGAGPCGIFAAKTIGEVADVVVYERSRVFGGQWVSLWKNWLIFNFFRFMVKITQPTVKEFIPVSTRAFGQMIRRKLSNCPTIASMKALPHT